MERISTFGQDERRPAHRQVALGCLYLAYLALFAAALLGILALWLPTGVPALVATGVGLVLALIAGAVLLVRRAPTPPDPSG